MGFPLHSIHEQPVGEDSVFLPWLVAQCTCCVLGETQPLFLRASASVA